MKTLCLIFVLLASPVHAQDRAAVSFYLAAASADVFTTARNMQAGHTENDPLYAFSQHSTVGTALSLAITDAVTLWLAHRYTPTHPKLVKIALFGLGGVRATQAAQNAQAWYLDTHRPFDLGSH